MVPLFTPANKPITAFTLLATFISTFSNKQVKLETIIFLSILLNKPKLDSVLKVLLTLLVSKILSKTILKGLPSSFTLELPPYRTPQIGKILIRSLFDRTLFVLGKAISIAAPAGIVIWLFSNINVGGISILDFIANALNPFAKLIGLDGYILTGFILGIPANEIVLPIILMGYLKNKELIDIENVAVIGNILTANGWQA